MVHFDAKLTGSIEDVSLADLLQLFHYARKSVALHVSGYRGGQVVMVDGEICHAECADQQGEEALASLLAQKLVRVRTGAVAQPSPRTVVRAFGAVVIDLLRRKDEYDRDTGDLPVPEEVVDSHTPTDLGRRLAAWLDHNSDVEHAALIDPREHSVLACDSPSLWGTLVQSLLLQTLVAPYFDDSFEEIGDLLPPSSPRDAEDRQTVVTFGGRRYVLGLIPERGWVAALVFGTSRVSHGLSLTLMTNLLRSVPHWIDRPERQLGEPS